MRGGCNADTKQDEKIRIAICEDNPIHAKILMRMIEKWQKKSKTEKGR